MEKLKPSLNTGQSQPLLILSNPLNNRERIMDLSLDKEGLKIVFIDF
jgi:hypothetical protein